ncbi:MAG: FAD-binding oxidoreductase [Candidatus Pacebacteria bacterium]|nr:FAD-binding oxidoreductase [Candidatus Paceibacterota bacterium]MCD8564004.1 FAD-binding oxidoreductase [Candidatus Paceibacterota bacterium]
MKLAQDIQQLIEGDVAYDAETLASRSIDWSIFHIPPQLVVFPKHTADIQAVMRYVHDHQSEYPGLSVTARAAGTDMTGGPLNTGIILDTTRYMQGIHEVVLSTQFPEQYSFYGHAYNIAGYARALPGTWYRDFERATLEQGLIMPCYPGSRDMCAIGGMVANNGAGEKTLKYGQNKDFVHELSVVGPAGDTYTCAPLTYREVLEKCAQQDYEGHVYRRTYACLKEHWHLIQSKKPRTSKNAAGYLLWEVLQGTDSFEAFEQGQGFFTLAPLHVGAQGTLGVIAEIMYKLVHEQPAHDLLVIYVRDIARVPELVDRLMQHDLEMLEMYDDHTFKIGIKFFKDFLKDKGFWGAIKYSIRFLPEVWMALTQGIPKLIVLAELTGPTEADVNQKTRQLAASLGDLNMSIRTILRDPQEEKFWDFRHDSFKLLSEHSKETRASGKGTRTAPFIDDIAINPEHLPEYLPRLIPILDEYKLLYTIAGHLGNGNFHIIPLMTLDEIGEGDRLLEISDRVYALALEYGASITAEHNDGIVRTPYLEQQFGAEMVALFAEIKDIFDPHHLCNPGKKVGGTKDDFKKWIARNV